MSYLQRLFSPFLMLLRQMTCLSLAMPFKQPSHSMPSQDLLWLHPILGLGLGIFYAFFYHFIYSFELPDDITLLITMVLGLLLTKGFSEIAFIRMLDNIPYPNSAFPEGLLGINGGIGLMMMFLLKFFALQNLILPDTVYATFMMSESLSRMPLTLLTSFFPQSTNKQKGYQPPILSMNHFFISLAISFAIVFLILQNLYLSMLLICSVLVLSLLMGFFILKQWHGMSMQYCHAAQPISSILLLCLLLGVGNLPS